MGCSTIAYTIDMTNALVDALVSIIAKSCKGVIGYICHEVEMKDGDRFADLRRKPEWMT